MVKCLDPLVKSKGHDGQDCAHLHPFLPPSSWGPTAATASGAFLKDHLKAQGTLWRIQIFKAYY